MLSELTRTRNEILYHPAALPVERSVYRKSLRLCVELVITALILAASFGMVAALGLAVTMAALRAVS